MSIDDRLKTKAQPRSHAKSAILEADHHRKSAAVQRYRQRLQQQRGVQQIYAPRFDPDSLIDPSLFKGSQHGVAQQVWLDEYEYPSEYSGEYDVITFFRKRSTEPDGAYQALGAPIYVDQVAGKFPLSVTMPAEYMADEGTFDFRFMVDTFAGDHGVSPSIRMTLDWTDPANGQVPGAPVFPFGADHLIDTPYLTGLPGGELIVTIPAPQLPGLGDRIRWAWLNGVPDSIDPAAGFDEELSASREVKVPIQVIQNVGEGNGRCYFAYILYDRALNQSHINYAVARVSLRPAPGPVHPPLVPLADDGLEYADIAQGIEILIPHLASFDYDDDVIASWGGYELRSRQIGTAPDFPLVIPVPSAALRHAYPETASGVVKTTISYAVWRGLNRWPAISDLIIDVDLSTIGPINPDWPDPVNPVLPVLTVTPANGNDNEIVGEPNFGEDATITFDVFQSAVAGDRIQLYWNDEPVGAEYPLDARDTPGTELSFTVPWATILSAGDNLQLPVHYTIRADGGLNAISGPRRLVKVLVVRIVLAPPTHPQTLPPNYFINCTLVRSDGGRLHVEVPGDAQYIRDGVEVTVHWRGFERADPSEGGPARPGAPVIASNQDITFTWTSSQPVAYIEPAVDRLFALMPPPGVNGFGFGQCSYSIEINGQTVESTVLTTRVALGTPEGLCPIPAP